MRRDLMKGTIHYQVTGSTMSEISINADDVAKDFFQDHHDYRVNWTAESHSQKNANDQVVLMFFVAEVTAESYWSGQ